MTVQQQIAERVLSLSDEGAELVSQLLSRLDSLCFVDGHGKVDVTKRFGAGEGIIGNLDDFDSMTSEIAKDFEGL